MCGITGFWGFSGASGEAASRVATAMGDSIRHRGPDDDGLWLDKGDQVAFGFRRLSILDLSQAGHQPMFANGSTSQAENGRFVFIFNGEIYNHQSIRQQLGKRDWRGTSDSETLLAAIAAWGVERALQRCEGMFAIAVWDKKSKVLSLARDRIGEKPLYYGVVNAGTKRASFLFGSELKALRQHPDFDATLNPRAVAQQLHYSYIAPPHTIYKGVYKLPQATILHIRQAGGKTGFAMKQQPYWSLADTIAASRADGFAGSEADATDALETLLLGVVKKQMLSDVPIGAFLSGGIDSSTVTALMQANSNRPINSFSIGFHHADYNEADYAKAIAKHLGTHHTELYVTPKDALDIIPRLPDIYDEPFSDSSQLPTFLLTQMVAGHVKVALSGDGGDELFAGYERYTKTAQYWRWINAIPYVLRQAMAVGLRLPPSGFWKILGSSIATVGGKRFFRFHNLPTLAPKLADVIANPDEYAVYSKLIENWPYSHSHQGDLLPVKNTPHPQQDLFQHEVAGLDGLAPIERMMAYDAARYLADDLLVKTDRAAMAVSLETRMPFLDHSVVGFAWSLPMSMKISRGKGKWILRQVLNRHVPVALTDRPKMGFGVPIRYWLRGELRGWADDLLSPIALQKSGLLNVAAIRRVWDEYTSGRKNWEIGLWNVLMFQAWLMRQKA